AGAAFERLVAAFDMLDGSEAFVHPDRMAAVAASGKRAERAALDEGAGTVADAVARFEAGKHNDPGLFGRIGAAWTPGSGGSDSSMSHWIALKIELIVTAKLSN